MCRKQKVKPHRFRWGFLIEKKRGKNGYKAHDRMFVLFLGLVLYTFAERFVIMCEKAMAERDSI